MKRYIFNLFFLVALISGFSLMGWLFLTAATSVVSAQDEIEILDMPSEVSGSQVDARTDVVNPTLNRTIMRTNSSPLTASCTGSGCIAQASAFSPANISVSCPTGNKCTFKLTFCGQYTAQSADDSLFVRFLIDGARPSPGPTDTNGFVVVDSPVPTGLTIAHCFSVVDTGNAAGSHSINVRFGVRDLTGDNASVRLRFAELDIQVFTSPAASVIHDVSMEDNLFDPKNLTIKVGDTVRWKNNGNNNHTTTSDDDVWSSDDKFPLPDGMKPGDVFKFKFTSDGTFLYHCEFHGSPGGIGMAGKITVTP